MNELENTIKALYKSWKRGLPHATGNHPSEETMACFLESRLSTQESEEVQAHLVNCRDCSRAFALALGLKPEEQNVPEELLSRVRNLINPENKDRFLEIILRAKEQIFEVLHTTGDIIVGQELVPAAVLRSRKIKDFKDEIRVLKDFPDMRVEVKLVNKGANVFDAEISVKDRLTQKSLKDVRISLCREDVELESFLAGTGLVTFEHVALGIYRIEIATIDQKSATVRLDIKG
ncbi:MAG: hypothetical protein NTZ92_05120 [Candidatus Omnitrophica bacterium]|nr:hypothetical protein [Candidatus Omnitrophota bacterium]